MKSIRRTWLGQMEMVKEIKSHPVEHWCYQQVKVYFKNGYIRIERMFAHPVWGCSSRTVSWFKGSIEEAKSYNRMLRWD